MADPTLGSNNPFRRKTTAAGSSFPPASSSVSSATAAAASASPALVASSDRNTTVPRFPPPLDTAFGSAPTATKTTTFPLSSRPGDEPFFPDSDPSGSAGSSGPSDSVFPPHHPTANAFREQLQAMPKVTLEAPPATTFVKPKPVKKVRVQSPPPSSPNSVDSDFEARFPADLSPADAPARPPGSSPPYYNSDGDDDDESSESDESSSSPDDDIATPDPAIHSATSGSAFAVQPSSPPPTFHHPPQQQTTAPPNPFQKTLEDLETDISKATGQEGAPAPPGKGTMDVDAFRRLLLTGQPAEESGGREAPAQQGVGALDLGYPADASSVSKLPASHLAQETTPRTLSQEVFPEAGDGPAQHQAAARKKPPPPSSRHGKLIRGQKEDLGEGLRTGSSDSSNPLSPHPSRRSMDNDGGGMDPDALDEATIPAPRPPTPPNAAHTASRPKPVPGVEDLSVSTSFLPSTPAAAFVPTPTPPSAKKATPAPPPRRHAHGRSENRASPPQATAVAALSPQPLDGPPLGSGRSSLESTRSLPSSSRPFTTSATATTNVPAPPPPRRVSGHASRPSTSLASPPAGLGVLPGGSGSSAAVSETDQLAVPWPGPTGSSMSSKSSSSSDTRSSGAGTTAAIVPPPHVQAPLPAPVAKLAKPPPPPTRGASLRRKEGRPGLPAASAPHFSGHAHPQPPPPPPRQRGSSRGSMDGGPAGPAAASSLRQRASSGGATAVAGEGGGGETASTAHLILADLDALQREVDALRGQYGK